MSHWFYDIKFRILALSVSFCSFTPQTFDISECHSFFLQHFKIFDTFMFNLTLLGEILNFCSFLVLFFTFHASNFWLLTFLTVYWLYFYLWQDNMIFDTYRCNLRHFECHLGLSTLLSIILFISDQIQTFDSIFYFWRHILAFNTENFDIIKCQSHIDFMTWNLDFLRSQCLFVPSLLKLLIFLSVIHLFYNSLTSLGAT